MEQWKGNVVVLLVFICIHRFILPDYKTIHDVETLLLTGEITALSLLAVGLVFNHLNHGVSIPYNQFIKDLGLFFGALLVSVFLCKVIM